MNLDDRAFIAAALASPTFAGTVLFWAGAALVLVLLTAVIGWRLGTGRRSLPGLARDSRGAVTAVDMVITLPIFFVIMALLVQFVSLANDALIVHYAAYAAARSARVWMWDQAPISLPGVGSSDNSVDRMQRNPLTLGNRSAAEVREHVEHAARFALIPAAPADPNVPSNPGKFPRETLGLLARQAALPAREGALAHKAAYAFDPRNSTIEYGVKTSSGSFQEGIRAFEAIADVLRQPADAWAVTAKVGFRSLLAIPGAGILGTRGAGGYSYRWIHAEMTVL